MISRFVVTLALAAVAELSLAQGGPPMLTDDTETVPTGKWEFNLAWSSESTKGTWLHEAPILDFNRGISDRAHVNFEVPWVFVSEGGVAHSGIGNAGVGCKWRLLDAKGSMPAISIHPAIEFGVSRRSSRLGLSDDRPVLIFPVAAQWELHGLGVNAESGVVMQHGSPLGWVGGLALGRMLGSFEALAEVHGEGVCSTGESLWIGQLGLRKDLRESSTLLFAFGRSIAAHKAESVRWTSYIALQFAF